MFALLSGWFAVNKLKVIEIGAVVLMVVAIFFAIWLSMHERREQAEEIGRLHASIATANEKIVQLEKLATIQRSDFESVMKDTQGLNDNLASIRTEIAKRVQIINKHDLGAIGARKPGLLEARINRATRLQIERLQEVTKP